MYTLDYFVHPMQLFEILSHRGILTEKITKIPCDGELHKVELEFSVEFSESNLLRPPQYTLVDHKILA
jgi:hypothetical protein